MGLWRYLLFGVECCKIKDLRSCQIYDITKASRSLQTGICKNQAFSRHLNWNRWAAHHYVIRPKMLYIKFPTKKLWTNLSITFNIRELWSSKDSQAAYLHSRGTKRLSLTYSMFHHGMLLLTTKGTFSPILVPPPLPHHEIRVKMSFSLWHPISLGLMT